MSLEATNRQTQKIEGIVKLSRNQSPAINTMFPGIQRFIILREQISRKSFVTAGKTWLNHIPFFSNLQFINPQIKKYFPYLIFSFHFWFRDLLRELDKKYEVLLIYLFLQFRNLLKVKICGPINPPCLHFSTDKPQNLWVSRSCLVNHRYSLVSSLILEELQKVKE